MSAKRDDAVRALGRVLTDSYALLGKTHLYHWNVEGAHFFDLHGQFEAQYQDLFSAVDELAERIRALGGYAPPPLSGAKGVLSEHVEGGDPRQIVEDLVAANQTVVDTLSSALNAASAAEDEITAGLLADRIQTHEKTLWMLRSFLKGA